MNKSCIDFQVLYDKAGWDLLPLCLTGFTVLLFLLAGQAPVLHPGSLSSNVALVQHCITLSVSAHCTQLPKIRILLIRALNTVAAIPYKSNGLIAFLMAPPLAYKFLNLFHTLNEMMEHLQGQLKSYKQAKLFHCFLVLCSLLFIFVLIQDSTL